MGLDPARQERADPLAAALGGRRVQLARGLLGELARGVDGPRHEALGLGLEADGDERTVARLDRKPGDQRQRAENTETGGVSVDRNELAPKYFSRWMDWARERDYGMDFNPTFFSHPNADDGFTLAHPDEGVRQFWIEHGIACREIGAAMGEAVEDLTGRDSTVIPMGVDLHRFSGALNRKPFDGASCTQILFVGRLEPRKGAKYLFKAMPEILRRVPEARLTVVGSGPMSAHYRSYLPDDCVDRVRFEGRVSADMVPRYFATADVYCSPATGGSSTGGRASSPSESSPAEASSSGPC